MRVKKSNNVELLAFTKMQSKSASKLTPSYSTNYANRFSAT